MQTSAQKKVYDDREMKRRYEKINGQTVMLARPNVNHGEIIGNIRDIFKKFLRGKRCRVLTETDVFFDEENTLIPDVIIVCDRSKIRYNGVYGAPDLAIEVLSPRTSKYDRRDKKEIYESAGVREYWIINPVDKTIEVYHLTDDSLLLDNVYHLYAGEELVSLDETERAEVKIRVKVSLYDDFEVDVADVFDDMTTWESA